MNFVTNLDAELRNRLVGLTCGVGAAAIWGGSSIVSRYLIVSRFDAFELTLLRYAACFPVATAIYWFWYPRMRSMLNWRQFAVLIVLAGPPFHFLVIAGYAYTSAGTGAVLISGLLAFFTMLTGVILRKERFGSVQASCILLVFGGVGLLAQQNGSDNTVDAPLISVPGVLIFGLAALLWAQLNHLIPRWNVDPLSMTLALAIWSPIFLPIYFITPPNLTEQVHTSDLLLQLIYHGWLVALGATCLFFVAVRNIGPESAALLLALAPALSVTFGVIILGEPATPLVVLGVVFVIAGFILSMISTPEGL